MRVEICCVGGTWERRPTGPAVITHPLSLSSTTVPELDPPAVVRCAADAGFTLAGVQLSNPLRQARTLVSALRGTGIGLLDVRFIRLSRGPLTDDQRRLAMAAGDLNARYLLVSGDDPDEGALLGKLANLVLLLKDSPTRVALEPMPFTAVRNVADAVRLATLVVGLTVVLNPLHLHRAGDPLDAPGSVDPEMLGFAQLSDIADTGRPTGSAALSVEARERRVLPGHGDLEVEKFIASLPAGRPISVEVPSSSLIAELRPAARAALVHGAAVSVLEAT